MNNSLSIVQLESGVRTDKSRGITKEIGGGKNEPNVEHLCLVQEEVDTCMILHASDAMSAGFERILIGSTISGTDFHVLLVAFCPQLSNEVGMILGTAKYCQSIPVHNIECDDEIRDSIFMRLQSVILPDNFVVYIFALKVFMSHLSYFLS